MDLVSTYEEYLLKTTNPKLAFTKSQTPDGAYENYYFDVSSEGNVQLTLATAPTPVNGDGTAYIEKPHGEIYDETKDGFYIRGIEGIFKCPESWVWNTVDKVCSLASICTQEDAGNYKGMTKYQFDQLNKSLVNGDAYHERLYNYCDTIPENSKILECTENTHYNGLEIQPATGNPCIKYDECSELAENAVHILPPTAEDSLDPDQFYRCMGGVSVKETCPYTTMLNPVTLKCDLYNQCYGLPDGYTLYVNEHQYIYCSNHQEVIVKCSETTVSTKPDGTYTCNLKVTNTYTKYYENILVNVPIECWIYEGESRRLLSIEDKSYTKQVLLETQLNTNIIKFERNQFLYDPIIFKTTFVEYNEPLVYTAAEIYEATPENLKHYQYQISVSATYHQRCLPTFQWIVLDDKPKSETPYLYYKFGNLYMNLETGRPIETPFEATVPFIVSNEIYLFDSIDTLYEPSVNWTIMYTCSLNQPAFLGIPFGYVLASYRTGATTLIVYINQKLQQAQVLEFLNSVVLEEEFCEFNLDGVVSAHFNVPPLTIEADGITSKSQCSSVLWYNEMDTTDVVVRPHFLLPLRFSEYSQLHEKFNILYTLSPPSLLSFLKTPTKLFEGYTPSTKFTGDSDMLYQCALEYRQKYITNAV